MPPISRRMPIQVSLPFVAITFGSSHGVNLVPTYYGDDPFIYQVNPSYLLDGVADSTIEEWTVEGRFGTEELQAQSVSLDDVGDTSTFAATAAAGALCSGARRQRPM